MSSLATLQSLAVACEGDMKVLRKRVAEVGTTAEVLIRKIVEEDDFLEVRSVGVVTWEWSVMVEVGPQSMTGYWCSCFTQLYIWQ